VGAHHEGLFIRTPLLILNSSRFILNILPLITNIPKFIAEFARSRLNPHRRNPGDPPLILNFDARKLGLWPGKLGLQP
jgi:hypothetical protein